MSLASLSRAYVPAAPTRIVPVKTPPEPENAPEAGAAPDGVAKPTEAGPARPDGFQMLTRYIPTEAITLYVAAMATRQDVAEALGASEAKAALVIYGVCAVLTLIILALMMSARRRQGGTAARPGWWPFLASLAAFLVWALSVPGHPVADTLGGLPALGALVLSTFLSLAEPGPKTDPAPKPQPDEEEPTHV